MSTLPCTARVAWGAFGEDARPPAGPRWHRCTRDRGHGGKHRATWQGHVYEWAPMQGGARKGAGRPRKAPSERASVRIVALATPGEATEIDVARGETGAGEWVLQAGLRAARKRRR